MKNIHVLPTDKPSRLVKQKYDTIDRLCLADMATKRAQYKRFNIYITSSEEIKEEDWVYCTERKLFGKVIEIQLAKFKSDSSMLYFEINNEEIWCKLFNCKKIILTTDQDLIRDGVQAIDDEFLEWFVKNPSCEYVKVIDKMRIFNVDELRERHRKGLPHLYSEKICSKIIIPKEEPKTKCYCGHTSYCDCIPLEPKQETLEEAAFTAGEESFKGFKKAILEANRFDYVCGFTAGAKWQQEQDKKMYSDEDLHNAFYNGWLYRGEDYQFPKAKKEWFKQFKNK